eukprot:Tbor_TRINITY_DN5415_c0_g1::TRINITY_DN5415_c0_g1_i2::g.24525::m.24525
MSMPKRSSMSQIVTPNSIDEEEMSLMEVSSNTENVRLMSSFSNIASYPTRIEMAENGNSQQESLSSSEGTPPPTTDRDLYKILMVFVMLKVLLSYDSGAFSISLGVEGGISDDLSLTPGEQGSLSASVYLGSMVGCAVAGQLFNYFSARMLLLYSIIFHGIFTFLFACSFNFFVSILLRCLIGVTLAFVIVYSPIWVDEFSPAARRTTWMALINVGVPVGVMIGFVVGGLMPVYTSFNWRTTFYFKCILLVPLAILTARANEAVIDNKERIHPLSSSSRASEELDDDTTLAGPDVYTTRPDGQTMPSVVNNRTFPLKEVYVAIRVYFQDLSQSSIKLMKNPLYIYNVAALSSLYFVATAIQNFVTPYLKNPPFNASLDVIVLGFGISVVTAPVAGVVTSGVLLDRIGGYQDNLVVTAKYATVWAALGCVMSVISMMTTTAMTFLLSTWLLLFCGAAIVPPATGIIVSSVPTSLRSAASSFSAICFSFFGYFLGPLACGYIIQITGSVATGIRMSIAVSMFGFIFMLLSIMAAKTSVNCHQTTPVPVHINRESNVSNSKVEV